MVWMPMRVPDLVDLPAKAVGLCKIFLAIWRIDRDGGAGFLVVRKKAVIVFQAGKLVNFYHDPI